MTSFLNRILGKMGGAWFLAAAAVLCLAVAIGAAESKPTTVTQGEFAARLVKELGLATGLPAEPKPADYRLVLAGKRSFRFEAEEVYNAEGDGVSLKNYPLYGPFTGVGWLSGIAESVTVRFNVLLPRDGDYLLKAVSRGDGQRWTAGGREFTLSTGAGLREGVAGTVPLKAGKQEISVKLPPEGGVDSFSLVADDIPAAEPMAGWRFDAHLTWGELAEVLAPLLGIEQNLPVASDAGPRIVAVHGAAKLPAGVEATDASFLGAFTPPKWVRAGVAGAVVEVPLDIAETGVYGLRIRLLGKKLALELDGKRFERQGKPFLDWYDLGVQRLRQGRHLMKIELPPLGGVDVIEIVKRKSSTADYLRATGLPGTPQGELTPTELDAVLPGVLNRLRGAK